MLPFSELIRKYFNFYKIFQSNLTWYSQSLLYWWKYFCRWSPEAVYVSSRILSFHRKPEIFFYQILFSLLETCLAEDWCWSKTNIYLLTSVVKTGDRLTESRPPRMKSLLVCNRKGYFVVLLRGDSYIQLCRQKHNLTWRLSRISWEIFLKKFILFLNY